MTYLEALKIAMRESFTLVLHRRHWAQVRTGLLAALWLCLRLALLLALPVSAPMLALAIRADAKLSARQAADARIRLRAEIHQKGRQRGT